MTMESSFDFYLSLPSSAKRKERLELYNISRPRLKLGFPSVIQTQSARWECFVTLAVDVDSVGSGGFCCWYGHALLPCCWGNAWRGAPRSLFLCCFTACSGMNCRCNSSTGGCLQLLFMPPPCHSYQHSIKVQCLNYHSLILQMWKLRQCKQYSD